MRIAHKSGQKQTRNATGAANLNRYWSIGCGAFVRLRVRAESGWRFSFGAQIIPYNIDIGA